MKIPCTRANPRVSRSIERNIVFNDVQMLIASCIGLSLYSQEYLHSSLTASVTLLKYPKLKTDKRAVSALRCQRIGSQFVRSIELCSSISLVWLADVRRCVFNMIMLSIHFLQNSD